MRHLPYLLGALLSGGTCVLAAPTTSLPEAQPVILVLPFNVGGGSAGWMGKAVQQDLLTDLAQATHASIKAPADASPAADPAAALRAAGDAGASLVVFGQVQTSGTEVRLTGQVLDVSSGKPIGNLKATGPADKLFHLEDALAGQALATVPRPLLNPQALEPQQQPAAVQELSTTASATPQSSTPAQATAPDAPSAYSPPASAAGDSYSAVAPSGYYYDASPPVSTYSYTYYEPAPVYTYPVPAYTYACPSYDLFPSCGPFFSFDLGFFGSGHSHFHDGRFHDGHFHDGGFDGRAHHGFGGTPAGGRSPGSGGSFSHTARGTAGGTGGFSHVGNFSHTLSPRGAFAALNSRSYRSPSFARGSALGSRARPTFGSPRVYSGAAMRGGGGSRDAFRGGRSTFGGGMSSRSGGFHGGGFHGGGGRR